MFFRLLLFLSNLNVATRALMIHQMIRVIRFLKFPEALLSYLLVPDAVFWPIADYNL